MSLSNSGRKVLRGKRCSLGLSLIELMVAVAIFGIVSVMGISSYRVWIQNTKIRAAAESIQAGLQKARVEAVKRNTQVMFSLVGAQSAWTIGCVVEVVNVCPAVIESALAKETGGSTISVSTTPGDAFTITFTNLGTILQGGDPPFTQVDIDAPDLVSDDKVKLRLIVGAGGQVLMCNPQVTGSDDPRSCPVVGS